MKKITKKVLDELKLELDDLKDSGEPGRFGSGFESGVSRVIELLEEKFDYPMEIHLRKTRRTGCRRKK